MRLLRYDHDYSRRHFLKALATGMVTAGVLMPVWDAIARTGDAGKAYPDELSSLEGYTRGKLKSGDFISAENVDLVRDLLEPIKYQQIKTMGRRLKLAPTTTDIMKLSPWEYLEATLRNSGKAQFDKVGNVVVEGGKAWHGGKQCTDAKTADEILASSTQYGKES